MKNKKYKLSSITRLLSLLQQIQMRCYKEGTISIHIDIKRDHSIEVSAINYIKFKSETFSFKNYISVIPYEYDYNELLDWIKNNK